jgi:hypothetical protein
LHPPHWALQAEYVPSFITTKSLFDLNQSSFLVYHQFKYPQVKFKIYATSLQIKNIILLINNLENLFLNIVKVIIKNKIICEKLKIANKFFY